MRKKLFLVLATLATLLAFQNCDNFDSVSLDVNSETSPETTISPEDEQRLNDETRTQIDELLQNEKVDTVPSHSRIHLPVPNGIAAAQLHPLPPYNSSQAVQLNLEIANLASNNMPTQLNVEVQKPNGTKYVLRSGSLSVEALTRWSEKKMLNTFDLVGSYTIKIDLTANGTTHSKTLKFDVSYNQYGKSLGYGTVAWFDPGTLLSGVYKHKMNPNYKGDPGEIYEAQTKATLQKMYDVGVRTVAFSYVEYGGVIYYDNSSTFMPDGKYNFFDVDGAFYHDPARGELHYTPQHWSKVVYPVPRANADIVKAVFEKADELGMSVIMGLGRDGDDLIINDAYHARTTYAGKGYHISQHGNQHVSDLMMQWRLQRVRELEAYKAMDLLAKYGMHESFVGFYISHEATDIISAIQDIYGPISETLKHLSPSRIVVAGPSNNPARLTEGDRVTHMPAYMAASEVDIFAWQDSVGVGATTDANGVLYQSWNPELRIPMLANYYAQIRGWINSANANIYRKGYKALWSVTESWEMDGTASYGSGLYQNYTGAFPAKFNRLSRQMNAAALNVDAISIYEFSSNFQAESDPWLLDGINPAPGGNCGQGVVGARCTNFQKQAEDLLSCYASAVGATQYYRSDAICY